MPFVTSYPTRSRWWSALRGFLLFFVAGGFGSFTYGVMGHHSISDMPWGGMLFGAIVCATVSGLSPRRRHR